VCFVGAPVEADSEIAAVSETTPTAAALRGPFDFPEFGFNTGLGRLAQLVERLLYTQVAGGSSPSPPIREKPR
jgi:hypothetical protein